MRNFRFIGGNADVCPLLNALTFQDKASNIWQVDTYLRDYPQGPFKDIDSVILRFPNRSVHETEKALAEHLAGFDQHENHDQPVFSLLPEARPLIFGLTALVQGERLGRCIINRIRPGGCIFPHADTPVHAEYWDRFHIVLQSTAGNSFRCGIEQEAEFVQMRPGEIWWFDNRKEHEVINNSDSDRIHLIIDIRTRKGGLPC